MKVIKDESKRKSMKNKCASLSETKNAKDPALIQIGGESRRSNKVKFGRISPHRWLTRGNKSGVPHGKEWKLRFCSAFAEILPRLRLGRQKKENTYLVIITAIKIDKCFIKLK